MQRANGTASLLFGAIIVLLSYATLAPFFLKGETNTARSFGPFTPSRERDVGAPLPLCVPTCQTCLRTVLFSIHALYAYVCVYMPCMYVCAHALCKQRRACVLFIRV